MESVRLPSVLAAMLLVSVVALAAMPPAAAQAASVTVKVFDASGATLLHQHTATGPGGMTRFAVATAGWNDAGSGEGKVSIDDLVIDRASGTQTTYNFATAPAITESTTGGGNDALRYDSGAQHLLGIGNSGYTCSTNYESIDVSSGSTVTKARFKVSRLTGAIGDGSWWDLFVGLVPTNSEPIVGATCNGSSMTGTVDNLVGLRIGGDGGGARRDFRGWIDGSQAAPGYPHALSPTSYIVEITMGATPPPPSATATVTVFDSGGMVKHQHTATPPAGLTRFAVATAGWNDAGSGEGTVHIDDLVIDRASGTQTTYNFATAPAITESTTGGGNDALRYEASGQRLRGVGNSGYTCSTNYESIDVSSGSTVTKARFKLTRPVGVSGDGSFWDLFVGLVPANSEAINGATCNANSLTGTVDNLVGLRVGGDGLGARRDLRGWIDGSQAATGFPHSLGSTYTIEIAIQSTGGGNNPPNVPSNPFPAHNANDASPATSLTWIGGDPDGNPVTYDVYRDPGATASTLVCNDITATTCSAGVLAQGTTYAWRVVARDSLDAERFGPTWSFTTTWTEHWANEPHNQVLKRVYADANVAVWHDPDVDAAAAAWVPGFMSQVVSLATAAYGDLRSYPVHVVLHEDKYGGGHPAYYYDPSHDNRNVVDVGVDSWTENYGNRALLTHELAHIVESTVHGRQGSPGYGDALWGDSKWAEFFIYDMAQDLAAADSSKYGSFPQSAYDDFIDNGESYPAGGKATKFWFRDLFYPLWQNKGSGAMREFFRLTGDHYHTGGGAMQTMNVGTFIHFLGASTETDMSGAMVRAFGADGTFDSQVETARSTYTGIYHPDCEDFSDANILVRVFLNSGFQGGCMTYQMNDLDMTNDAFTTGIVVNDQVSSVLLKPGWKIVVYEHINFGGATREYLAGDNDFANDSFTNGAQINDRVSSIRVVPI